MVKVAVLGCGLMGIKIAGELAYHGHRVKVHDSSEASLNSVYQRMEEDKTQLRQDGLLAHKNFIGQVLCMGRLEETVNDAEFIFEVVPDDMEIKKDVFERVSHLCRPDAVIASNTLRCNMNDVVERTEGKERTIGLRFLFPVYYIPEVEITPNKFTSSKTIEKVRVMLEKMGKTLFFRSGSEPLILSEEQRDDRKKARLEQLKSSSGMGYKVKDFIPTLSHSGNVVPQQASPGGESDHDCAICMDNSRNCVLRPCNHMVMCYDCGAMLINRRDCCPICRIDITEIIRVYHS